MRIHLAAVYYIILVCILFGFAAYETALAALACGLVIGAELLNTALERLCDGLEPGRSPLVKTVKDLAAGAVLVCAAAAVTVAAALLWRRGGFLPDLLRHPAVWAGAAAAPFWFWFVFGFGGKK
jgi:undecaprenol kinase/diacylglycerol kinase (ATP)